jgi:hypothetical protein
LSLIIWATVFMCFSGVALYGHNTYFDPGGSRKYPVSGKG